METQSTTIRSFTDAWKRGDDSAINRITTEIIQGGNDAEVVAMSRVMAATKYGSEQ
jgi:hypothetical protein